MADIDGVDWVLAIDFGTSYSSAAMGTDESIAPIDVQGLRRMPSMVLLNEDGRLLVGVVAANQSAGAADRLERTPKAAVGTTPILLLGGRPVQVTDAVAAFLTEFVVEGRRQRGGTEPLSVTLTHPVRWGQNRLDVLRRAAASAGIDPERVRLVEEPVAAACALRSDRIVPGAHVGVFDLGGGTFDVAILKATDDGFVVAGPPGGDDHLGGEIFDEQLLAHIGEHLHRADPAGWESLSTSQERRWQQAHAGLREQVRLAKETLSVAEQTRVYVTGMDRDVVVTREEFERLIEPDVARSIDIFEQTLRAAGLTPDQLAAVYPVGGSSRIPLIANRLLERYGDVVTTWDDPQAAVALGAARLARDEMRSLHRPSWVADATVPDVQARLPEETTGPETPAPADDVAIHDEISTPGEEIPVDIPSPAAEVPVAPTLPDWIPLPTDDVEAAEPEVLVPAATAPRRRWQAPALASSVVLGAGAIVGIVFALTGHSGSAHASGDTGSQTTAPPTGVGSNPSSPTPTPTTAPSVSSSWPGQPGFWWLDATNHSTGASLGLTLQLGRPVRYSPDLAVGSAQAGAACDLTNHDLLIPAEVTATNTSKAAAAAAFSLQVSDGSPVEIYQGGTGGECKSGTVDLDTFSNSVDPAGIIWTDFFIVAHNYYSADHPDGDSSQLQGVTVSFRLPTGNPLPAGAYEPGPVTGPNSGGLISVNRAFDATTSDCALVASASASASPSSSGGSLGNKVHQVIGHIATSVNRSQCVDALEKP